MNRKCLVALSKADDVTIVERVAGEILAKYPDSILTRCDEQRLISRGTDNVR